MGALCLCNESQDSIRLIHLKQIGEGKNSKYLMKKIKRFSLIDTYTNNLSKNELTQGKKRKNTRLDYYENRRSLKRIQLIRKSLNLIKNSACQDTQPERKSQINKDLQNSNNNPKKDSKIFTSRMADYLSRLLKPYSCKQIDVIEY